MTFDINKCGGCHTCELICSWAYNEGVIRPYISRIHVIKREDLAINVPMACQQCEQAPCREICPVSAINRNKKTGAMIINEETCIGCRVCQMACPFGAIGQDPDNGIMIKCDLCEGSPKCVQWCPNEAIKYEEVQKVATSKQRRMVEDGISKAMFRHREKVTEKKETE